MQTQTNCPRCNQKLRVGTDKLGKLVGCPKCQQSFSIDSSGSTSLESIEKAAIRTTEASADSTLGSISKNPTQARSTRAPRKLGRFEVVSVLGAGGFGRVYKAKDPSLDRFVALKVPMYVSDGDNRISRFLVEAKAAARLRHPNIVTTYESGKAGNQFYIATEYIKGELLSERLERGSLSFSEAAEIVRKLAVALQYAHKRGIIHRDLKPHNVMLDGDGEPQLMDFGLAKRTDDDSNMTTDGSLLGTPAYMSPEQARGEVSKVDALSDQYSLGVILYYLLTGSTPHSGAPYVIVSKVAMGEYHPVREKNSEVDATLEAICQKAMMPERGQRYQSCEVFAADLLAWSESRPVLARPMTRIQGWIHRVQRHKVAVGTALGIIFGTALLGFVSRQAFPSTTPEGTRAGLEANTKLAAPVLEIPPAADVDAIPGDQRSLPVVSPANNDEGVIHEESLLDYLPDNVGECLLSGTAFKTESGALFISDEDSSENKSFGMLEIPFFLPETYRLTLAVRPTTSGGALLFSMPHQGFPVGIVLDGSYGSGLDLIDGQDYRSNASNVPARQFSNRQLHSIQITSSPEGLFVDIDGTRLTEFTGPPEKLSLGRGNRHPNSLFPAVKVFHGGGFLIEEATIQTSGSNAVKPAGPQRIKLTETERAVAAWVRSMGGETFFDKGLQIEIPPSAKISDSDFQRFQDLPNLTSLIVSNGETNFRIAGIPLSDEAILHLNSLPRLRTIVVGGNEITDRSLEHLASFPIEELTVFKASVTNGGLRHFKNHNLRTLALNDCQQVRELDLNRRSLAQVETLHLRGTHVPGSALADLVGTQNLRELSCASGATGETCQFIGNLESLEVLEIVLAKIDDRDLHYLSNLRNLKSLSISRNRLTENGLQFIANNFPLLENLDFGFNEVNANTTIDWTGLQKLESIYLYPTRVSDQQLLAMAKMSNLNKLTFGPIDYATTNLSPEAMQTFANKLPKCRIWDATAKEHVERMRNLSSKEPAGRQ